MRPWKAHHIGEKVSLTDQQEMRPIMWKILALGAGLALVSISTAMAQPQCDQRDSVLKVLEQKYKEAPVALGVTHNGGLVEVLSSGNGTTWSIIVTTPQGMSCLVAAGEGWKAMQQASIDPEA
jgi:hypothetical protein